MEASELASNAKSLLSELEIFGLRKLSANVLAAYSKLNCTVMYWQDADEPYCQDHIDVSDPDCAACKAEIETQP